MTKKFQNFKAKFINITAASMLALTSLVGAAPLYLIHTAYAASSGDVWITAAMPNPAESGTEYVTLKNISSSNINLNGWTVDTTSNHAISTSESLASGASVTICDDPAKDSKCADGYDANLVLPNSDTTISLKDASNPSNLIDQVSYTAEQISTKGHEVTFSHDTTGPEISKVKPSDWDVITKGGTYTVSAKITDPSGVQSVSYNANTPGLCIFGDFCPIPPDNFSDTLTDADTDGVYTATLDTSAHGRDSGFFPDYYTFTITAKDNLGNTSTAQSSDVTFTQPSGTITGQDFSTWDNSAGGFKAINVGFKTKDFMQISSLTVTLQKDGKDLVTNKATPGLFFDPTNPFTPKANGSFSTPFVISGTLNDTYCSGSPCWDYGTYDWTTDDKPDKAVITVSGIDTDGRTVTNEQAEISPLTEPSGVTFDSLLPPTPVDSTAPSVPTLVSPINRGYEKTNDFYFTWNASTDDSGQPLTYEFQSDSSAAFASPWDSLASGNSEQNHLTSPEIHSTGAPDGTYYWHVRAIDAAGNKSNWSDTWKMTIDTHAPTTTLNVGNLRNGYVNTRQHNDELTLTGSASDNLGLNRVYVQLIRKSDSKRFGGQTVYLSGTADNWQATINAKKIGLTEGGYYAVASVTDSAGNSTTTPFLSFTLDNTKPTVAFTSPTPADGSYQNSNFTVGYEAHDNYRLKSVNVSLFDTDSTHSNHWVTGCYSNGVEAGTDDSGTCTVKLPANLPDGRYYVQVGARDESGLWSVNAVRYVNIDRTAPVIDVTSPVANATVNGHVQFTGSVYDKSNFSYYYYYVTGPEQVPSVTVYGEKHDEVLNGVYPGQTYWDSTQVPDGDYVVHFVARDTAGNVSTKDLPLTVDNTGPAVDITSLQSGDIVKGIVDVQGTISDPSGLSYYYYYLWPGGHSQTVYPSGNVSGHLFDWDTTKVPGYGANDVHPQADGTYKLVLVAVDSLGNSTQYEVNNLTIDNTRPSLRFVAPTSFSTPFAIGPHVEVKASDANGLSALVIHVYDSTTNKLLASPMCSAGAAGLAAGTLSCDLSGLKDGTYYVKAGTNDTAGNNRTITSDVFTVDGTAPVVTDDNNFNVNMKTGDKVTLTPTVTDGSSVTYSWVPSDSKLLIPANEATDGTSLTVGAVPAGSYSVALTVTDQAGNQTVKIYNITVTAGSDQSGNSPVNNDLAPQGVLGLFTQKDSGNGDDQSDTPSGNSQGQVKGDSISLTNQQSGGSESHGTNKADQTKSSAFFGQSWLWGIVALVIVLLAGLLYGRRKATQEQNS